MGGKVEPVDGTSASTPLLAALVARLNDALSAAGKPQGLGFLNPLLYSMPSSAFNDVVQVCGGMCVCVWRACVCGVGG